jgi:uncharacterized protein YecA (UPF0149 family)
MNSEYDEDDYTIEKHCDTFFDFTVDEDGNDLYDDRNTEKLDQVEFEMSLLEQFIVQAAIDGVDVEYIERLEDELELLAMDYHKLRM